MFLGQLREDLGDLPGRLADLVGQIDLLRGVLKGGKVNMLNSRVNDP